MPLAWAATALSIFSLANKTTVDSDEPDLPKKLTPAGRRYVAGIIALAAATAAFSLLGDHADSRLSDISSAAFRFGWIEGVRRTGRRGRRNLRPRISSSLKRYSRTLRVLRGKLPKLPKGYKG